jgi:hypothetical protein
MPARIRDWSTTRLRLFAAATIVSAAVISFDSIRHLAESAGFGPLAWLFPLTLDAVAAYGMDLWVRRSAAMKQARALALAAIFLSLAANVADHWLAQRSVLGALLGAIPPAMLAALLSVAHRHGTGVDQQTAGPDPEPATEPDRVDRYRVPDHIAVPDRLDHADPIGPPVGPLLVAAGPRSLVLLADEYPDRETMDRVKRTMDQPRKRTSAARTPATTVRRTATVKAPEDQEIVSWISGQPDRPTKQQIMDRYPIGSGRALRLRTAAAEESHDG